MIKDVIKLLKVKKLKIAFAESVTGGLLSSLLTDQAGASLVFELAIVSYSNLIKENILNIKEETIKEYGVVSKEVAEAMALAVKKLAGSDIAVGITGSAGPTSLENSVIGEVWFSIFYLNKFYNFQYVFKHKSRVKVKKAAAKKVFLELYKVINTSI